MLGVNRVLRVGGVEAIHVGRTNLQLNTAVHLWRLGNTLVDSGPSGQWRKINAVLSKRAPIEQVVLTHHHEDHSSGCCSLIAASTAAAGKPCTIYGSPATLKVLTSGFEIEWYRRLFWGAPLAVPASITRPTPPTGVTARLDDGSEVTIVPIPAPGHSADHSILFVPERGWLFTGDLYLASRPKVGIHFERPLMTIWLLEQLLEGPHALPITTVFCSHRGPVTEGREALQTRLDYMRQLRRRAVAEYKKRYPQGHHDHRDDGDTNSGSDNSVAAIRRAFARRPRDLAAITAAVLGVPVESPIYYLSGRSFGGIHLVAGLLEDYIGAPLPEHSLLEGEGPPSAHALTSNAAGSRDEVAPAEATGLVASGAAVHPDGLHGRQGRLHCSRHARPMHAGDVWNEGICIAWDKVKQLRKEAAARGAHAAGAAAPEPHQPLA